MALSVNDFDWVEELVEKNRAKHGVEPEDMESALLNCDPAPCFRRVAGGKYIALAQVEDGGEFLFIVFTMPGEHTARVISARPMSAAEKGDYRKRRGK